MATTTINYSSSTPITCAVESTASSSTFIAGRESNEIDNTVNKYMDALVRGKVTVGSGLVANTQIGIYVWGAEESLATAPIDVLDGVDSAESLTNTGVLFSALKLGAVITITSAVSNLTYDFAPFSVASLFGGALPKFWGLYVAHNTGANLNATAGNHEFSFVGVKYDVA